MAKRPRNCGRMHPQPYCLCDACCEAGNRMERIGDAFLTGDERRLIEARRIAQDQVSQANDTNTPMGR